MASGSRGNVTAAVTTRILSIPSGLVSTTSSMQSAGLGDWYRDSATTPGFRAKRWDMKDLPMNNFRYISTRSRYPMGLVAYLDIDPQGNGFESRISGLHTLGANYQSKDSQILNELSAKAVKKLLGRLKGQSVNAAIAVGELGKTMNLFVDTAQRIARSLSSLRKGDFYAAAGHLGIAPHKRRPPRAPSNDIRQRWLELQYGWLPTLSDVFGAAEHLANVRYATPRLKETAREFRVTQVKSEYMDGLFRTVDESTTRHEVKYVVYYSHAFDHESTQLGFTNPASVAWELLPGSFIFDWLLPIGSYLDQLDATRGLVFLKGCKTEFFKDETKRHQYGANTSGNGHTRVTSCNLTRTRDAVDCSRAVLSGFPAPIVPSLRNPYTRLRAANALALVTLAIDPARRRKGEKDTSSFFSNFRS